MNKKSLKLLVFSDIHAVVDDSFSDDSHFIYKNGQCEFAGAFLEHLKRLNLSFDALICPGDLANKSQDGSFQAAWTEINNIQSELSIPDIFCVPGNHDHDSRTNPGIFDPKHRIQFITPPFPTSDSKSCTHFWAWHWCNIERDQFNAILINTSAFHGYGDEHQHGRISTQATDYLINFVNSDKFERKPVNFIVCHHHPIKMEHVDQDYDIEAMEGGQYLLNQLESADKGTWIVFHGHKHFPEIRVAPSTSSEGITILSAGSLSARLHGKISDRTSNQFYIIDIDLVETEETGRAVGRFETYEWTILDGWHRSKSNKLPAIGGFGSTYTPTIVARKISKRLDQEGSEFLDTNDLKEFKKIIDHMPPPDIKKLREKLEKLGLKTIFQESQLIQVGK